MNSLIWIALVSGAAFAQTTPPTHTTAPSEPPAMTAPETASKDTSLVKMAKVVITEPKDGATVSSTFTVKMTVEGMKIATAGTNEPGTGHHHLIIDGTATPKGKTIPTDATHVHYGKGQSEAHLTLKPGKHTITDQFADGAHVSYGEMMSSTIHITVK